MRYAERRCSCLGPVMPESPVSDDVDAVRNRRAFLGAAIGALVAAPLSAFAQPQLPSLRRIGFLSSESASNEAQRLETLRAGLRDLGYVEGRNIVFEVRWAEGHYDRLPALAAELVGLKPSAIVASGTKASLALKNATRTIPIVVGSTGDPLALGLVTNLARPGGNVTGSTFLASELAAKRLELLKEALPSITRVAFLVNPADPPTALQAMEPVAKALKLELPLFEARASSEFDSTFAGMAQRRVDAVVVQLDTLFIVNSKTIADLALKYRLPSAGSVAFAEAGGMIGSGANSLEGYRRAATYVDKILKGASPGDLPIEQPTKFQLVINLKTAQALGLTMPQTLLVRADNAIK
jgi:putative ABC transport system substrate-binding protein